MSTIDTHTNWGASYFVQDIYRRFICPDADERKCVRISRICIVIMALCAGITALFIQNIVAVWRFVITLGAGLGSISATRWYWSRVTPHAEFAAIGITTVLSILLQVFCTKTLFGSPNPLFVVEINAWAQILIIAISSLLTWIPVALWGPQNDPKVLANFVQKVRPSGPGWKSFQFERSDPIAPLALRFGAGLVILYGSLFGLGHVILGNTWLGIMLLAIATILLLWVVKSGKKIRNEK